MIYPLSGQDNQPQTDFQIGTIKMVLAINQTLTSRLKHDTKYHRKVNASLLTSDLAIGLHDRTINPSVMII